LSLAPLLLVVTGIVGLVFGSESARKQLQVEVQGLMGTEGAQVIDTLLANSQSHTGGILSTVVGLVTLLVGATSVFAQMQDALNTVWELPDQKTQGVGVRKYLRDRLLSFSVVAGLAFLLLVSILANVVFAGLEGWLHTYFGIYVPGVLVTNTALAFVLATALFALIFRVLPTRRVPWKCVVVGAIATAAMFILGKHFISLYLGTTAVGSAFGAAGSLVVLLVWIYYSSQMLLLGAALTRVYADRYCESCVTDQSKATESAD